MRSPTLTPVATESTYWTVPSSILMAKRRRVERYERYERYAEARRTTQESL